MSTNGTLRWFNLGIIKLRPENNQMIEILTARYPWPLMPSFKKGGRNNTVDGRYPAPADRLSDYIQGFYTSQVMQDVFHQQT